MKDRALKRAMKKIVALGLVVILVCGPNLTFARSIEEKPSGFAMVGDLVVARPLGLVLLSVGTVAYVVSLPFAVLGGNARDVGRTLVVGPARETFVRCLGCRRLGRKEKIAR